MIFQCTDIPDGKFEYFELNHFTCPTATRGSVSCIYLCGSRAGNPALWKHFFKYRIIPFCQELRSHSTSECVDLSTFLTSDGEAVIMNQALDDEIQDLLSEAKIIWAKLPASTTSVHQPCDRAQTFKSLKSCCTNETFLASARNVDQRDDMLANEIRAAAAAIKLVDNKKLPSGFIDRLVRGCLLVEKMCEVAMKKGDITRSFVKCGHHVPSDKQLKAPEGELPVTISPTIIMRQCHAPISDEQMQNMLNHLPFFSDKMRDDGRIAWADMDDKGIAPDQDVENRENLVLSRRACEIITSPATLKRQKLWHLENDPECIAIKRVIAGEARKQATENRQIARSQRTKDNAAARKAATEELKASMTKQEYSEHLKRERKAKADAKAADEAATKLAKTKRQEDVAKARERARELGMVL